MVPKSPLIVIAVFACFGNRFCIFVDRKMYLIILRQIRKEKKPKLIGIMTNLLNSKIRLISNFHENESNNRMVSGMLKFPCNVLI